MLYRLSIHFQKEIAFSLLYIFILSGIVSAKAKSYEISTFEYNVSNSCPSNHSKKTNSTFSSNKDEKDKDRKSLKAKVVPQKFSGKHQRNKNESIR